MILSVRNEEITVQVPSTEHANLLMDIAEHLTCVVQKYYWQSKYSEHIEEIEPKITDAFDTIVILRGDDNMLSEVYKIYEEKARMLDNFPTEPNLTEEEIKNLAVKVFQKLDYSHFDLIK